MGEVFLARDQRLGRLVALKCVASGAWRNTRARHRFEREVRAASAVTHPFVATVFDTLEHEHELVLVMEYIEGQRLDDLIRQGDIDLGERIRIAAEIAEGLAAIHRAGFIHRDLKPSNIMIGASRHVKILDFGVSRFIENAVADSDIDTKTAEADLTRSGFFVGSPRYASPEQIRGEPCGFESDVFSLGIVVHEVLTGNHPFRRPTSGDTVNAILTEPPQDDLLREKDEICHALAAIVERALAKERSARHESAGELAQELRSLERSGSLGSRPSRPANPMSMPPHPLFLRPSRTLPLAAGLVIAIAAGAWLLHSSSPETDREAPRVAIALTTTPDPDCQLAADLVTDVVAAALGDSCRLDPLGHSELARVGATAAMRGDPALHASEWGRAIEGDLVVAGSLARRSDPSAWTIDVTILSLASTKASDEFHLTAENLAALTSALTRHLDARLGRVIPIPSALSDARIGPRLPKGDDATLLLWQRARRSHASRETTAAIAALHEVLKADDTFALAHALLAEARLARGEDALARDSAERALARAPRGATTDEMRTRIALASIRARAFGKLSERLGASDALCEIAPYAPSAHRERAAALTDAGRLEDAGASLERAHALAPWDLSIDVERAALLTLRGKSSEARTLLASIESAAERRGDSDLLIDVAVARARLLFQDRDFAAATLALEEARTRSTAQRERARTIDMDLLAAQIDVQRGQGAQALGNLASIIQRARTAGNLPVLAQALTIEASQRFVAGDLSAAEPGYREAVDIARRLERDLLVRNPLYNLAQLLSYRGALDEAEALSKESIAVARRLGRPAWEATALALHADIAYQRGMTSDAIASFTALLQAEGAAPSERSAWTHLALAEVNERQGLLGSALRHAVSGREIFTRLGNATFAAYGSAREAQLLAGLGRDADARSALSVATAVVETTGASDLAARVAIARSVLEFFAEDPAASLVAADAALAMEATRETGALHVPALVARCEALRELGRVSEAIDACRSAVRIAPAPRAEHALALAALARALAQGNAIEESMLVAREAASIGNACDLPAVVVRAIATGSRTGGFSTERDERSARSHRQRVLADCGAGDHFPLLRVLDTQTLAVAE